MPAPRHIEQHAMYGHGRAGDDAISTLTPIGTLIVTDLWWNYPEISPEDAADVPLSSRLWKVGMDAIYRPVYNRFMRTESCKESYATILGWDWDYIAPCHGEPVAADGKRVLTSHLNLRG